MAVVLSVGTSLLHCAMCGSLALSLAFLAGERDSVRVQVQKDLGAEYSSPITVNLSNYSRVI